ncbi:MAG: peptide chain release factor N(5)-glutamine methyltransferase [Oscillospiraceae bacterium]|jgi:release factor glutamine methyltransferase|nr:peptide chain release factor N(5)-glutamine methyltransferase [Oscillospiraceae bacterium]
MLDFTVKISDNGNGGNGQKIFRKAREALQNAGIENFEPEARWLFEHFTGARTFDPVEIPADKAETLRSALKRRISGEPLQYILGECEFYSLRILCEPGVLIPRPDTELLVDMALERIKDVKNPRVLDLCAGTGCVAVAIAKNRPDACVRAADLFEKPLEVCRKNIDKNGTDNCRVIKLDVLCKPERPLDFDLITANPPYIKTSDLAGLQREVLAEPQEALDGGADGLVFYRSLCENFLPLIKPGAALAVEVGHDTADEVFNMLCKHLGNVNRQKDLSGIVRVISGKIMN